MDLRVTPAQVNGIWIPKEVEQDDALNKGYFRLTMTRSEINQTVPDSTFNFETMDFDRTKAVLQKRVPGYEPVNMVFRDGQWVVKD